MLQGAAGLQGPVPRDTAVRSTGKREPRPASHGRGGGSEPPATGQHANLYVQIKLHELHKLNKLDWFATGSPILPGMVISFQV